MSKIDGRFLTLNAGATEIADNLITTTPGKALDARQGQALNERLGNLEKITGIDCGEITLEEE